VLSIAVYLFAQRSLEVADIDGDGDLDVLIAIGLNEANVFQRRWGRSWSAPRSPLMVVTRMKFRLSRSTAVYTPGQVAPRLPPAPPARAE
jgi:hypothetical protein